jgi:cephalosporin hydroxylase
MRIVADQKMAVHALVMQQRYRNLFFEDFLVQSENFAKVTWLGQPIWQNVLDLWTIQETICEVRPQLLIECGTNQGGSSLFYAHLLDLLGSGRVLTIDVEKMHELSHPRVRYLIGSSVDETVLRPVHEEVAASGGPVLVILDSDHSAGHVLKEMEAYGPLVTPGSFLHVQDGSIDVLEYFARLRPGPLVAIRQYLERHAEFEVDVERCTRFPITHHPEGWLRKKPIR